MHAGPRRQARRLGIPTRPRKPRRPAPARRARNGGRRAPAARSAPAARRKRPAAPRPRAEQPLGVGVADPFAMRRLGVPTAPVRRPGERGVREVGWAEFGDLARDLAERIGREFQPAVVLGVVHGGVFLGGALALSLSGQFQSARVFRVGGHPSAQRLRGLEGLATLVVDNVTHSGATLRAVVGAARRAGAGPIRTATLVVRPDGHRADFHALTTDDVVVFPWDYQFGTGTPGTEDPGDVGV